MKKKLLCVLALILTFGIFTGIFAGCNKNNAKAYAFTSNRELYAFSVVSGMELALDGNLSGAKMIQSEFETMVDSIHSYLPSFEGFLGGDKLIAPQEKTSDNAEYAKLLTVDYTSADGIVHNYKIYYNETVPSQNNRPWADKDDDEIETDLVGIVVLNNNTYSMTGKKEIEKNEVEIEFEIMLDDNKRVKIQQETEAGEQEFEYELYYGANIAYKHSLSIEIDNDEIEFETEYETNNEKYELEIKQDAKNPNRSYVEYEKNKKKFKIIIDKTKNDGNIQYIYRMENLEVIKNVGTL